MDIKRLEPNPPPYAEFLFHNMPTEVRGIDFHVAGLQDAIQMTLGRDDVIARRVIDPSGQEEHRPKRPEIHIDWIGKEATLVELRNTAFANPPKTKQRLAEVPSPYITIYPFPRPLSQVRVGVSGCPASSPTHHLKTRDSHARVGCSVLDRLLRNAPVERKEQS